jgi:alkylated DNA repair dioxygenase AlkB
MSQAELFETPAQTLPEGMRYRDNLISEADEASLAAFIQALPLKPFEFAGGFKGNRRVLSFGSRYDYNEQRLLDAKPIPPELDTVRQAAARFAGLSTADLKQALVTEYPVGAGIGWHRDKKMFGDIIGVSLLSSCKFRLRLRTEDRWDRVSLTAQPRSAYLLSGPSRSLWEHSIPPMQQLRLSITFRTFAKSSP